MTIFKISRLKKLLDPSWIAVRNELIEIVQLPLNLSEKHVCIFNLSF